MFFGYINIWLWFPIQDDTSSVIADVCLNDLDANKPELDDGFGSLNARARALKGLTELVQGNTDSCMSLISDSCFFLFI